MPTSSVQRFLLLLLLTIPLSGLLPACAESDSDPRQSAAKLQDFDNLLNIRGTAGKDATKDFTLENVGLSNLIFSLTPDADWLTVAPASGTIEPDKSQSVTFTATCPAAGEPPQTVVDIKTNDPDKASVNLYVSLKCNPAEEEEEEIPEGKASLTFEVTGVPPSVHGALTGFINVYKPDGSLAGVIPQGKLTIDEPGTYKVKAEDIIDGETLYEAPPEFSVEVTQADFDANSIPPVTVAYTKVEQPVFSADLEITIEGLPEGVNAHVDVLDPAAEVISTLTATRTIKVREAGTYKVQPHDVTHNGTVYQASDAVDVVVTQETLEENTLAPVTVLYDNPAQVKTEADNGPGSLRAILGTVPADSTITFAPGVENIVLTSTIELTQNVTIDGGRNVTIDGNDAHQIFTIATPIEVTLRGLTLTHGASVTSNGGAISNVSGTLHIENCLFDENETERNGGAIATQDGVLTVTNTTFNNNSADLGGAIFSQDNDTTLAHVTISNNIATLAGGIAATNEPGNTSAVRIRNSIIADNLDISGVTDIYTDMGAQPYVSLGYNLIGNGFGAEGFIHDANNDQVGDETNPIDPLLGGLASNDSTIGTMSIGLTSPAYAQIPAEACLDAGGQPLTTDQRGTARPTYELCDIGAFERGSDAPYNIESFDLSPLSTTYVSGSFEGNNGITWNYAQARNAASAPIAGAGLIIRHHLASDEYGFVAAENIPGGIKDFSVKVRKGASGAGARQVELFVNGISYGTSQLFGSGSTADPTIHTFTVTDINVAGDFKLEIRHITPGTSSNGRQITIDHITWTSYP